jgi:hypothetical protein
MSNIFVYGVTFFLLKYKTCPDDPNNNNNLTPSDAPKFMILTFIVCGVGIVFQVLFHVGTKEDNSLEEYQRNERSSSFVMQRSLNWKGYLKTAEFYQVIYNPPSQSQKKWSKFVNFLKGRFTLHVYKTDCKYLTSVSTHVCDRYCCVG